MNGLQDRKVEGHFALQPQNCHQLNLEAHSCLLYYPTSTVRMVLGVSIMAMVDMFTILYISLPMLVSWTLLVPAFTRS